MKNRSEIVISVINQLADFVEIKKHTDMQSFRKDNAEFGARSFLN
jgi:hypothetical protein